MFNKRRVFENLSFGAVLERLSGWSSINGHQLPATAGRLPPASGQQLAGGHRPAAAGPPAGPRPPATGHQPPVGGHRRAASADH